jgi:hypothetical protein
MSFPLMPVVNPSSNPGVEWRPVGSISSFDNLAQVSVSPSGVWVATSDDISGRIYTSTNYGATWSSSSPSFVNETRGSAYGGTRFVVSEDGDTRVLSSPDGSSWTNRYNGATINYNARFNDGYFVIGSASSTVPGGAILASADGVNWTFAAQGAVGTTNTRCGIYVASLGRTFAAGASSQAKYVDAVPTAATPWTGNSTGVPITSFDVTWSPVASIAVLVGSGGVYSSTDLISWTLRVAVTNFYGVAWCDTQFVAVGSVGKIYTSPDGVTWTSRTSGTSSALYGVASQGGVILATGWDGTVLRSS